jgi:hypothetical protein
MFALTTLYKGAILRICSQGMPQTKRGDIAYDWRGSLEAGKQRHPRCHKSCKLIRKGDGHEEIEGLVKTLIKYTDVN